jgi:hypothetical protein
MLHLLRADLVANSPTQQIAICTAIGETGES